MSAYHRYTATANTTARLKQLVHVGRLLCSNIA